MNSWETFCQALAEYNYIRPRRLTMTLPLVVGSQEQRLPDGVQDVNQCSWGERAQPHEVLFEPEGSAAWAFSDGKLIFSPTPTDSDVDPVVTLLCDHIPDEETQTVPTLPQGHIRFVEELERAQALDREADDLAHGPVIYTIGQTQVDRKAAIADLRNTAESIRQRVNNALYEPVSIWA